MAGTSSDAGKSLVVTGLCRSLARRGIAVAPFKAQNMSNNSGVCSDGSEIGRAQFLQARAARVEPTSAMNPVLLKPGSDRRSHIVLRGRAAGTLESGEYATGRGALAAAAWAAYDELTDAYDVIICEGAGSPTEINLRSGDYVNLGLARAKGLPVTVVGDIDRGGVLAALYGTVALLDKADRAMITSFMINKFRGDPSVLEPGLEELTRRTGVGLVGVLPWLSEVWLDGEDALDLGSWSRDRGSSADLDRDQLNVVVLSFPRVSNITDIDALAAEPGVRVRVTASPEALAEADLVILPGSRATISDLGWLRAKGLDAPLHDRARRGRPILGICGGYQMLAETINDEVESGSGSVTGLGLLPTTVRFAPEKTLGRPTGSWRGQPVEGYEIHHGLASPTATAEPFLDGCQQGSVWGTMWHGTFENDDFRRAWLAAVASVSRSAWRPDRASASYGARREAMIERLADAIDTHVDLPRLLADTRIGHRL